MTNPSPDSLDAFVTKWSGVVASELSTSQTFLLELCHLLQVDTPHPTPEQDYMFERPVTFVHGNGSTSPGRIDLYRRGAFVLESKKLKAQATAKVFDDALLRARSQAEAYARALPAPEGRPPFLVVVDVGHRIELYAEFSQSGATYTPYPDPSSHRITLQDLRRPEILDRLRRLWTDPLSLDPSREAAKVTRAIAEQLAQLARSLEQSGHATEAVAQFLKQAIFTMFAEDVGLLPKDAFRDLLAKHAETPDIAVSMLAALWRDMDTGGFSAVLANKVLRFNGKLFKEPVLLPLTRQQLEALRKAASADWRHVEPAIFGTLLERALSPGERHKLGAHYTPRAYVERLILPTVIEPLRAEWSAAHAAALTLAVEAKPKDAVAELLKFHHRLCNVKVLDCAAGSANFLYVTLEHLKRLEGEVLNALDELDYRQSGLDLDAKRADVAGGETVDPHNLLGIEINPRAAALAELVLWIGYLQWHFRTRGDVSPPEPVVRDFHNIENRDALLTYDRVEPLLDDNGSPITVWDGVTTKASPITGDQVPDENARRVVERYVNARKASWPAADFIVGNPPFIGNKRMRAALGDGYVEALRAAWPEVPESADFVMFWWHHAAQLTRQGACERFGLITTNSIRQSFNRRIVEGHLTGSDSPLILRFAVPDHPWVDAAEGASVRISMTVADQGQGECAVSQVVRETPKADGEVAVEMVRRKGLVQADLTVGPPVFETRMLLANAGLATQGVILVGEGFRLSKDEIPQFKTDLAARPQSVRPYMIGKDLMQRPAERYVIDLNELSLAEATAQTPGLLNKLIQAVKPGRDSNKDRQFRDLWWRWGRSRRDFMTATAKLPRYIATCRTATHRVFTFLPSDVVPDAKIVAISLADAAHLGVLQSAIHVRWAEATGGWLGFGNDSNYNHSDCFGRFPFPSLADGTRTDVIRRLAEQIDAHRKHVQLSTPELTLTGIYNVLEALRAGTPLSDKDRATHDLGRVSVLRQLHDDLDAAVLAAYGWLDLAAALRKAHGTEPLSEGASREDAMRTFTEAVLERLVAFNAERATEEAKGLVHWLRPEFQNPGTPHPTQGELEADEQDDAAAPKAATPSGKPTPWPKDTVDQVRAVAELLSSTSAPMSVEDISARFTSRGRWKSRLPHLLEMLVAVGRAEETPAGEFVART